MLMFVAAAERTHSVSAMVPCASAGVSKYLTGFVTRATLVADPNNATIVPPCLSRSVGGRLECYSQRCVLAICITCAMLWFSLHFRLPHIGCGKTFSVLRAAVRHKMTSAKSIIILSLDTYDKLVQSVCRNLECAYGKWKLRHYR